MLNLFKKCSKKNIFSKIVWFFKCIKYTIERAKYGFCSVDIENFDYYFLQILADGLKYFSESDKCKIPTDGSMTIDEWKKYLNSISEGINHFTDVEAAEAKNEYSKVYHDKKAGYKRIDNMVLYTREGKENKVIRDKYWQRAEEIDVWRNAELKHSLAKLLERLDDLWM